jgi:hypothetical protein
MFASRKFIESAIKIPLDAWNPDMLFMFGTATRQHPAPLLQIIATYWREADWCSVTVLDFHAMRCFELLCPHNTTICAVPEDYDEDKPLWYA